MPLETYEQLLDRAAELCGISPGFWDIWGHYHETTLQAKRSILRALGMGTENADQLRRSLHERESAEWLRLAAPVMVVSESAPREFPVSLPAGSLGGRVQFTIVGEDGGGHVFEIDPLPLPQVGSAEVDGRTFVRKQVRIPVDLPLGYYDVALRHGDATAAMRYIVTPDHAWSHPHLGRGGKAAGVAISLYGVRSGRNWGCGDFRDLIDVVDWASSELHLSFVALNPLHAIHNRRPFNTSPYLPNSTFYQNFIYLDVEGIEDFAECGRAQRLWHSPEIAAEVEALRAAPFVEYERVAALKLRFLKLGFAYFLLGYRAGSPRSRELRDFIAREGDLLERFATYCALDAFFHHRDPEVWVWKQWPEPYHDPESPETAAFRRRHWRTVLFYQYLQWQIDRQLAEAQRRAREKLSIGLYHDLALATDSFGSDLWAHRPFYAAGCRVGSPPDDFAPKGQDWGFPPPHSEHHRENGYRLFAESIRKNCRHGGALRMDHVMRLFRLYWIPDGSDASEGAYVRERYEDFVRVLALESVRNQVVIIGEDLGTVEPFVRETLQRFGILSYRLFYFERREGGAFKQHGEYPVQALVSTTTHDLPTIAGFWSGEDIAARRRAGVLDDAGFHWQMESRGREKQGILDLLFAAGLLPDWVPRSAAAIPDLTGELHNAIIGFLALTPSQLLCVNQEDLTKELAQQNLPSTTWEYPNWSRKMRFTLEELHSSGEARGFTAMLRNWIDRTGRRNSP